MGREGDQDPDAPGQGGVDQRLGASGDQSGLLERQDRLPYMVVHDNFSLKHKEDGDSSVLLSPAAGRQTETDLG